MFGFIKKRKAAVTKPTREWTEIDDELKELDKLFEKSSKTIDDLGNITTAFINSTNNMLVERRY